MSNIQSIVIPDIGTTAPVTVIEIMVKTGDHITRDQSLITLESDKASMEIPAPVEGTVADIKIKIGDKVTQGQEILTLQSKATEDRQGAAKEPTLAPDKATKTAQKETTAIPPSNTAISQATVSQQALETLATTASAPNPNKSRSDVHAGPIVRQLAREFDLDLAELEPTGPKQRILREDVQRYVKNMLLAAKNQALSSTGSGFSITPMPAIDFTQFGAIETKPLARIKKISGTHLHRSWVAIPHVTQFDNADITDLEAFRVSQKNKLEAKGIKLTPIVFIMKAVVAALKLYPQFNSSLSSDGSSLIYKQYYHIGVAVDTPNGLMVPVIRDVDQKGLSQLAQELSAISKKAREKGLMPNDMSGGCFTISSLGGIGGTAFTPIVNAPEVAILGVSKAAIQPVYDGNAFQPRLILPLSLSYDHRVIDGAEGARFSRAVCEALTDIRGLLL